MVCLGGLRRSDLQLPCCRYGVSAVTVPDSKSAWFLSWGFLVGVLSSVELTFLEVDLNVRSCDTNCAFMSQGDSLGITSLERKQFTAGVVFPC